MKVLLALVVVLGALVFAAGVSLAWQNRASDTLRTNGLTALFVGLVAGFLTLWFSLKTPERKAFDFPVVFVIDQRSDQISTFTAPQRNTVFIVPLFLIP